MKPGDVLGHFLAIDPLTGQKKWEVPLTDLPGSAGMLATGGGLVFTGKLTGEFVALDAATGKTLWQFKTGSSVNSTAITYTHNGRQYVTIASGRGGLLASRYTAGQGADGRLDLDVRADARLSRSSLRNESCFGVSFWPRPESCEPQEGEADAGEGHTRARTARQARWQGTHDASRRVRARGNRTHPGRQARRAFDQAGDCHRALESAPRRRQTSTAAGVRKGEHQAKCRIGRTATTQAGKDLT